MHDHFGFGIIHGAGVYGVVLVDSIVLEIAACSSFFAPLCKINQLEFGVLQEALWRILNVANPFA
jgi:hypothetical protein